MFCSLFLLFVVIKAIDSGNPCGLLYFTQSPHKSKNVEINWHFQCPQPPDTILLTHKDPTRYLDSLILNNISTGSIFKGNSLTKLSISEAPFPGNWNELDENPILGSHCFDLYVTSFKNGSVVHSQCLSIHPTWMSSFGELRIGELMIPGTHNSGAYKGALPIVKNFVLNQDRNFWDQLVYGIRYFDIRIGRYNGSPQGFYINHYFVKCTELLPELQRIARFLEKSPKEVVILNFHRFEHPKDFLNSYHLELVQILQDTFGELIYPFSLNYDFKGPKLRDFWRKNQRLIISYRNENVVKEFNWLWPGIIRDWGNVQKLDLLENYIKVKISQKTIGNPMRVLMAELTPNYLSVIKNSNLKDMSVMVNHELSDWLLENDAVHNLNIVATDFFTGNDMINLAIETNHRKRRHGQPIFNYNKYLS